MCFDIYEFMSKSFLQSQAWLSVYKEEGKTVHQIAQGFSFVERHVGGVAYWYGPHVSGSDAESVISAAKKSGAAFIRISPVDQQTADAFSGSKKVKDAEPSTSLVLDLTQSEDQLLAGMKSKTRYNVNLAQRKGVRTEIVEGVLDDAMFEQVWKLYEQTAKRKRIRNHPNSHYQIVSSHGFWVLSWLGGELLVANFCVTNEGTTTYLYGASSDKHKDIMAPYAAQWETIKWAKSHGNLRYDFWGIAPDGVDDHPYASITRFKKGFGGEVVTYPGTFDLVLAPFRYWLFSFAKKLRPILK